MLPVFVPFRETRLPLAVRGNRNDVLLVVVIAGQHGLGCGSSLLGGFGPMNEVVVAPLALPVLGARARSVPRMSAVVLAHLRDNDKGRGGAGSDVGGGVHAHSIAKCLWDVNPLHDKSDNGPLDTGGTHVVQSTWLTFQAHTK